LVCTALFLNNNQIRSIKGLNDVLQFVMFSPQKLEWLDLSYNYLQNIDKELLNGLRDIYVNNPMGRVRK
jgi:Leucine-rich repeat (LRR) protein